MDSEKTINSANDFSVNYDDYIQNCHWAGPDILFGLMFEYIKPAQTILDIGIGTGLSSKLFRRFGLSIYGIDGANRMIQICKNKALAEELRQVDLAKDEKWFENKIFHNIVSHGVFHLIRDLDAIFKQSSSILESNGCFGFTYEGLGHSFDSYLESSTIGVFERENMPSGIMVFRHTDKYIDERLVLHGFEILKKTEFLAFYNPDTNANTYFKAIVARKK